LPKIAYDNRVLTRRSSGLRCVRLLHENRLLEYLVLKSWLFIVIKNTWFQFML